MTVPHRTPREIELMRRAGRVVADVLALMEEELRPGVTTGQLDAIAEAYILKAGARPSFKGYRGFPGSICVSINEEVVHGIPGKRVIEEGQVVSIDAGAIWQGYHGDAARTFYTGTPPADVARLIDTTRLALMAGISAAVPGSYIEHVSGAVEDVAIEGRCDIVRPFVGHGIGTEMHEDVQVPNYRIGRHGVLLEPGVCIAIEPMLALGSADVKTLADGWTVVTTDHSLAAHFEHTIAVTESGPVILTTA
ncbi:MAG TPA: type I methionyl aminopeptidase [Candidatus Limnocylindrales bacterium]|nr:type I methionyl aminopeptidase [Candidatus Limnocylindrales bacterium]